MNELSIPSDMSWKPKARVTALLKDYVCGTEVPYQDAGRRRFRLSRISDLEIRTQARTSVLNLKLGNPDADWDTQAIVRSEWVARVEQRVARRLREAAVMLRDSIEMNIGKRGGAPVLKGTRVPIAQILADLANNANVSEIADDLDLSESLIRGFLQGMAIHLDRPFFK